MRITRPFHFGYPKWAEKELACKIKSVILRGLCYDGGQEVCISIVVVPLLSWTIRHRSVECELDPVGAVPKLQRGVRL